MEPFARWKEGTEGVLGVCGVTYNAGGLECASCGVIVNNSSFFFVHIKTQVEVFVPVY